jgi:glycosyltransferase involved in cell wall biosynthesis
MNLLFLINKYPNHGGTEVVTTVLANAFVARGHHVGIVSFEQLVPELLEQLDSRVHFHPMSHPFASKQNQEQLHEILVEGKIDFILNQWCLPYYVSRFCRKAMRGTNCKLIAVHHNAPDQNSLLNDTRIKLGNSKSALLRIGLKCKLSALKVATILSMRHVYRLSDRYVVLSGSFVPLFQRFTKCRSTEKLAVIGNPLTISADDYQYDAASKEKLIIYVGRVDHNQKRVERVIDVWERIASDLPDWRLEVVGDGPERERLEAMAVEKSLPRISFEGFQDPVEYYKRASILLLTSEYEGFGLVIVEAMAFGCVPVVLGSYSAVYDIITDSEDGYILPAPYDLDSYAQCVKTHAQDDASRGELARSALSTADRFALDSVVSRWESLLLQS